MASLSRRGVLKAIGLGAIAVGGDWIVPRAAIADAAPLPPSSLTADTALSQLIAGNQRYVAKRLAHPHQTQARILDIAQGQHPFAIVLGCADSRVPPEIIFDQGLGDLFTIRVAGNILDDAILGSIEFGVAELGIPLVVVLGHERCGAVTAALQGGKLPGHLGTLIAAIQPAIEQAKTKADKTDVLDAAVRANVQYVTQQFQTIRPFTEWIETGKVKIVGARYDLDQGAVELIT